MTHRLRPSTRIVATVVSLTAAAAAADVVHTADGAAWSFAVATLLAIAAVVVVRFHEVGLRVEDDVVTVRNLLSTHELPREDVVAVFPGAWCSRLVLADGTRLPILLRADDLPVHVDLSARDRVIDLTELSPAQ